MPTEELKIYTPSLNLSSELMLKIELIKANLKVKSLLELLKKKDLFTYEHSLRVAHWSLWFGSLVDLSDEELFNIYFGALFHDIGKIMTPDRVLKKPGPLSKIEFSIMKYHPVESSKIIRRIKELAHLERIIKHHHERVDGKGYPLNFKNEEIPFESKIILIIDTFDAMANTRPYRKGLSLEKIYQELLDFSGTQFDYDAAHLFVESHKNLCQESLIKVA